MRWIITTRLGKVLGAVMAWTAEDARAEASNRWNIPSARLRARLARD